MKPYLVSLINAILLITLSLWGYVFSNSPSATALIPTIIGVLLLICIPGVKNENKVVAHIAVVLTLLVLLGLLKPLMGAADRGDIAASIRVALMLASTALSMIFFVKSFIDVRNNRE